MRGIKKIKNLKGKKVLVRVDFNLPFKNGKVEDDFRIKKTLPTIKYLQGKGARIILISHLGKGSESMSLILKTLSKHIKVKFVPDIIGLESERSIANLKNGEIVLLENLRNDPREKENNTIFAKKLSQLADIYINEAFSVSHRKDASIVSLPKYLPSFAGFQLEREIKNLSKALKPKHPFLFILGGAKFSTKIPLIKKYLKSADFIFIGGALANDFIKAQGYEVGQSLISEDNFGIERVLKDKKLILPIDILVKSKNTLINKKINEVKKDEIILDIGKETIENISKIINRSKLILWNGPLGKYEEGGEKATTQILKIISQSKAESLVGGGDTVALISKMKIEKELSFVSTGGGATVDFLTKGSLPGIKALG